MLITNQWLVEISATLINKDMKELLIELVKVTVAIALCIVAFFALIGIVALLLNGIEILPQYIGGLFTFLLYIAGFTLFFALIIKTK